MSTSTPPTSPPSPAEALASPPTGPPARPWRLQTFSALRHRNYRLYFVGQLVSLTGSWVQTTALTWLAYHLTGQNSWPAAVAAAQVLPTLALGVWGGSLADRGPRRHLIFATQSLLLLLALTLGALAFLGAATPPALLLVAVGIGVVNAVDTPARMAFVIDMVGRDDLANAVGLNSLLFNVARAVGPAASAELMRLGAGPCFLVNGLSFVAVLAALACMHLPRSPAPGGGRASRACLAGGFRHLAARRGLVRLVALAGALAFFGWPFLSLLPDLSARHLAAGNAGYARMLSGVGFGALVGALLVATFSSARGRRVVLGAGVVLTASSLGLLGGVRQLLPAVGCCAALGCGLILFFASNQAALQLGSGDHNRGRIMGVWLMVLSAAQPLGHLVAGRAADAWGVPAVLRLQALGVVAATACVLLASRQEAIGSRQ